MNSNTALYFAMRDDATALRAENERLRGLLSISREALRFYGNDDEYHIDVLGPCGIAEDRDDNGYFGKRARMAFESSDPNASTEGDVAP